MVFVLLRDCQYGTLPMILSVVRYPGFSQNLAAKPHVKLLARITEIVGVVCAIFGNLEGVRGGAKPNDRAAPINIIDEVRHLLIGHIDEPHEDDHQVGLFQYFQSTNVTAARLYRPIFRVKAKDYRTLESVMFGHDPRKGRQCFFAAIFMVRRNKNDMLTLTDPSRALVDYAKLGAG